jgi:phosphonoacetaldehyde hydrolase
MHIKGVLFDFMGTTANEKDTTVIHQCFVKAFRHHGVEVADELIKANRGKDKKEIVSSILQQYNQPSDMVPAILDSFNTLLINSLDNFVPNKDTQEVMRFLKEKKIIAGLGTGFPRDVFELIFNQLGWADIGFDYIGIAEETGRGRPHPDMIIDMLKKFRLEKVDLLKVGDTVADILEGKNAGVKTVAILAGTQDENELRKHSPDFIIHELADLKQIVTA